MMGHSFLGGYLGWVLHYPKVYMATAIEPRKRKQQEKHGWVFDLGDWFYKPT